MNIQQIRQKYPQYSDLSDEQLAKGLHQKFYSDLSFDVFAERIGFAKGAPSEPVLSPEEMLTPVADTPEAAALRQKTREYEAGTSLGERVGRDIKRGVLRGMNVLPSMSAVSRQKEIEKIRRGEAGRTDPMTGEFIPLSPEEQENAINILQQAQMDELESVAKREAQARAIPGRPVTQAIGGAKTFGEAFEALATDPFGAMAGFAAESLPQMAPALAIGAVTRQPIAGAAAMGGTSLASELGNSVFEYLSENGVDINDTNAVMSALDDPKLFKEAYDFALKRGAIIGAADAATAGLASKALVPKRLIGSPKAREAINIAIAQPAAQVLSGAGGEAAAQLATYGEIRKPGEVVAEAVGEGPTSIAETAAFGGRRIYEELRSGKAAPTEAPKEAPKPAARAAAPRVEPTMPEEEKAEAPVTPAFAEEELEGVEAKAAPAAKVTPDTQAKIDALQKEYAAIDRKRLDPMLTPDSPEFVQFDERQAEIREQIDALKAPKGKVISIIDKLEDKDEADLEKGILETEQQRGATALTKDLNDQVQKALSLAKQALVENSTVEDRGRTFFPEDTTTAEEFVAGVNYVYEGLEKGTLPNAVTAIENLTKQANALTKTFEGRIADREALSPKAKLRLVETEKPKAEAKVDVSRYADIMQQRNEGKTFFELQEENPDLDILNTVVAGLNQESTRKTKSVREKEVSDILRRMLMDDRSSKEIPSLDQDIDLLKKIEQVNNLYKKIDSQTPAAVRKPIQKQIDALTKEIIKRPMGRYVPEAFSSTDIQAVLRTSPQNFEKIFGDRNPSLVLLLNRFNTKEDLRKWYNSEVLPQINKYIKNRVTNKSASYSGIPYTLNYLFKQFDEVKAARAAGKPVLATEAEAKPEVTVKPEKPAKPTKEEQAAINRQRQAEQRAAAEAKKAAKKPAPPKEEAEIVEPEEEAVEAAPPAAEVERKPVEREFSDEDIAEQLKRFESGNFGVPKSTGVGEEGRATADEMNAKYQAIYKEAARVFLESPIKAKPGKLEMSQGLKDIAPIPLRKAITVRNKTFDDQVKNLETTAASKDIRFYLNGVYLNLKDNEMVSTDGHRLAQWKNPNFDGMPPNPTGENQIMTPGRDFIKDAKYPDYVRVIPPKHDKDKTRIKAEPLGDYARGVNKAAGYIGKEKYAPMTLLVGDRYIVVNSKYIADMTDVFRRFGYDSFDLSIGFDEKQPLQGTRLLATSPDGKLVQVIMPVQRTESKFAPYRIPGVKTPADMAKEIKKSEEEIEKAKAVRESQIKEETEARNKRIEAAKESGEFSEFIDDWVGSADIDAALYDLMAKDLLYKNDLRVRAEAIREMVDDGFKINRDSKGKRFLSNGKEQFNELTLTDTGLDYAQYLLAKKAPLQENIFTEYEARRLISLIRQNAKVDREEAITRYSAVRTKTRRAIKEVAKYGSDIPLQKQLNKLLGYEQELKDFIKSETPIRNTANDFLAKAAKELANKNISQDVFDFISTVYQKQPSLLEGLRLSVRSKAEPSRSTGNFNPFERIITLWKNGSGVDEPGTIRHELTHTLEQMMLPSAQEAVADAWANALESAMKTNIDMQSKRYFEALMKNLEYPSKENFEAAANAMPEYSFYQYMNPSEYWAVNAEKLMAAQMGAGWDRFKKTIRKLYEFIKSVFGFDNTYVVHREFDKVMRGDQERITKKTIASMLQTTGYTPTFLNNVEDVDNLLEKHNRPDAPLHPSNSVKDRMLGTYRGTKKIGQRVIDDPLGVGKGVISGADRAITYIRNKNTWYGTGVDQADFSRYNGQLRDAQGKAVASIAVTNAIHAGHVGTQVMVQGGLEYNDKTKQFMAVKRSKSMANVLKEKAKLVDQLGAQRAANVIQAYFEAKRSRSIIDEYLAREQRYQDALDSGENPEEAAEALANIERAASKVNMDDEQIDEFIALEKEYPELRAMMDNWTAVNQNQLDMSYFAGNLSKARYEQLKAIKDYVPWYRIMDDQKDPHDFPTGGTTRTMTNVAREKRFKAGEVELDIDDIVDNMIHNVMWMTKNTMRNYAANRIADEYGIRNEKGKLKVFPKEGADSEGVKFNILRNGRRIVIGVADPLIAEAAIGMENVEIPMNKILSIMANGLRRSITLSGAFQLKQLFMDAPTAAWVSGVKNPFAVWANTFIAFGKVLVDKDPIAQKLRQAGIGGFMSTARTPEQELALEIGLLNKSAYAKVLRVLDHIGDASDYAQRVAIYKQVLKETGDEAQALLQANNVIDFLKRGSGQTAQYLSRTVAFMNAYAQSIDVLATALAGGGLKGMARQKAITRMAITGALLSFTTLLYCFAVGDDEEYEKLDDQTKLRNFVIPGSKKYFGYTVALPMHTSASFFFKAIPELLYNKITREGTETAMDSRRFRKALKEAFMDSMLGPNVVPTGVKPFIEIGLNKNFWTGTTVIPKGMEDLEAAEQYNAATSELGKVVSALTSVPGTDDKRLLAPIEADHLMRSLFGSAAAMAMWGTNMLAGDRAESRVKDLPVIGAFVLPPVPRGREDLFYDLKEATDQKWKTFNSLLDREKYDEADKYLEKHEGLIGLHDYTSQMDSALKEINKEIRRIGTTSAKDMSPKERREQMNEFGNLKGEILEGIESLRRQAFD